MRVALSTLCAVHIATEVLQSWATGPCYNDLVGDIDEVCSYLHQHFSLRRLCKMHHQVLV